MLDDRLEAASEDLSPSAATEGDAPMALPDGPQAEVEGSEPPDDEAPVPWRPAVLVNAPYWALSALFHAVVLLVLFFFVVLGPPPEKPGGAFSLRISEGPERPKAPRDTGRATREIRIERPPIEIITPQRPEQVVTEIPKGTDLDHLSTLDLQGDRIDDALGLSGGATGAYGERWSKGSLVAEGGSAKTQSAVRAALDWLVRHQEADGSWSAHRHLEFGSGSDAKDWDIGVTALAVLAFTGDGQTHRSATDPRYRDAVRQAMDWLLSRQVVGEDPRTIGRFGTRYHRKLMYDHAIATLALGELSILSGDVFRLHRPVRAATEFILRARNPGSGWRYGYRDGESDTSVTGWMVLALKTSRAARLGIPEEEYERAFGDALRFLDSLTDARGVTGYTERGRERGAVPCMTSVAVLCRLFGGQRRSDREIRLGVEQLGRSPPTWRDAGDSGSVDMYYWYYATYALFQYGGRPWSDWNGAMQEALLSNQRQGAPEVHGSWDPVGVSARRAGRVYSTAIGAMTLEVYYRYRRATEGTGF